MRPEAPTRRPSDDLVGALGQPLGDLRQLGVVEQALGNGEDALDLGLLGAGPDDLRARLAAHEQVERVGEHGLAGARSRR